MGSAGHIVRSKTILVFDNFLKDLLGAILSVAITVRLILQI